MHVKMIKKYRNHTLQFNPWHRESPKYPTILLRVHGDLVYKFKRIVGKPHFSDQLKNIVKRYIRVGYNLDIMRQSACLVLNPITVYSYGFLFNCTTVGQASDSMTALT